MHPIWSFPWLPREPDALNLSSFSFRKTNKQTKECVKLLGLALPLTSASLSSSHPHLTTQLGLFRSLCLRSDTLSHCVFAWSGHFVWKVPFELLLTSSFKFRVNFPASSHWCPLGREVFILPLLEYISIAAFNHMRCLSTGQCHQPVIASLGVGSLSSSSLDVKHQAWY